MSNLQAGLGRMAFQPFLFHNGLDALPRQLKAELEVLNATRLNQFGFLKVPPELVPTRARL